MNQPSAPALYNWPPQAAVGRVLPKNKIYEHAKPSAAVRALFVAQVEQIIWRCKLAPETVNLAAKRGVPEVEVFELALKTPELDKVVLRCIDKAIPFPILFELRFDGRARLMAAHKRPSDANPNQWVLSDYFATPWQDDILARLALPVALDLRGLYEQMLRTLMPLPPRSGESLQDQIERVGQWRSERNEAAWLQTRLRQEKQFNRKVALNAQLRGRQQSVDQLAA